MLDDKAAWRFTSKKPLTQWYGHVHLLENDVVGQWFCLNRLSGGLKWQRRLYRANTISGIERGVIVANETRSDGPWTAGFGCYGLSLETGEQIWVSHGSGFWGVVGRILDFVPGYTNEFRDNPQFVKEGKVFCTSGRVLEIATGKVIERKKRDEIQSVQIPKSDAWNLYNSSMDQAAPKVRVGDLLLSHPTSQKVRGELSLVAETGNGDRVWEFNIRDCGRHIDGNFYSYRLSGSFIYLIVSEQERYKPHPSKQHYVLPNPTRWAIFTLDVFTGKVVQEISLGDELVDECRIEDIDDEGLLIGTSTRVLMYFTRRN